MIATRRADEIDWITVRPWLYGIARGVLANQWRSQRRRQRLLGLMAGHAPTSDDQPEEVVVRRAEDLGAIKALERMRPADRGAPMLSAWEELTGPEIAQALGLSVAAASSVSIGPSDGSPRPLSSSTTLASQGFTLENEGSN